MTWTCKHCHSDVDDDLARCWQCGVGVHGEPPPSDWRSERGEVVTGSKRSLVCLRCTNPMTYVGMKQFQEGSYVKEALLGEFFMKRERIDVYQCNACGKLEFFAPFGS